jgi:hypothetical protein
VSDPRLAPPPPVTDAEREALAEHFMQALDEAEAEARGE